MASARPALGAIEHSPPYPCRRADEFRRPLAGDGKRKSVSWRGVHVGIGVGGRLMIGLCQPGTAADTFADERLRKITPPRSCGWGLFGRAVYIDLSIESLTRPCRA